MVKPYQRIVSLVCIACETCECEKCNVEDLSKRIIADVRADAIEECKQILLDAMARDGKTKCHEYMVAVNEIEQLKEQNR